MDNPNSTTITISTPAAIIIAGAIIGIAIYMSNTNTQPATSTTNTPVVGGDTTVPTPQPTVGPIQVTLGDDPTLGNPDAPVTMIEFSDYECPFCQRHYESSYAQLKADFIDTGKVKLVFRDLPLPFHEPMASKNAIAAHCAREQAGDEGYFRYHDQIFERTTTGGNGITVEQLYDIASDLNLDRAAFQECLDEDRYADRVAADLAYAGTIGISATPSFVLGLSTDGDTVTGTPIIGAQAYATYIKPAIEALLAEAGS